MSLSPSATPPPPPLQPNSAGPPCSPGSPAPHNSLLDLHEDKQTLALIRRVLRPQSSPNTPLDEILPALTSSPVVDVQLYAFLAIICRDFILSWYSKITNDRTFVDEIIKVFAHTTRSLEQRLRHIDLEVFLLDEVPCLLDSHVRDYRQCVYRHQTALCPHMSIPEIFHNLQPHPALGSSPDSERLYLKLLSSGILAVLLPTEDLQSNCERTFIREILSDLVLWNVVDKLSQPWLLYEIIPKILGNPKPERAQVDVSVLGEVINSGEDDYGVPRKDESKKKRRRSRYERRSSKQVIMKHFTETLPRSTTPTNSSTSTIPVPVSQKIEKLLAFAVLLITITTTAITSIYTFISNPPPPPRRRKPILRMSFLKFISNLLQIDVHQPWLKGNILLALFPFAIQPAGGLIDSLLSDLFKAHLASPELLAKVLASSRAALFPSGSMGPPRPYPTREEQVAIREAAVQALLQRIPTLLKRHYFGANEHEWREPIERHLDLFGEREVNRHLVYQILELVVVRLVPEIGETKIYKLMAERVDLGVDVP